MARYPEAKFFYSRKMIVANRKGKNKLIDVMRHMAEVCNDGKASVRTCRRIFKNLQALVEYGVYQNEKLFDKSKDFESIGMCMMLRFLSDWDRVHFLLAKSPDRWQKTDVYNSWAAQHYRNMSWKTMATLHLNGIPIMADLVYNVITDDNRLTVTKTWASDHCADTLTYLTKYGHGANRIPYVPTGVTRANAPIFYPEMLHIDLGMFYTPNHFGELSL